MARDIMREVREMSGDRGVVSGGGGERLVVDGGVSVKVDKLSEIDPRGDGGMDIMNRAMGLLRRGMDIAGEGRSVSDITRILNVVLRFKEVIYNDPEVLMKIVDKMDDEKVSVMISLLERHKLLKGFKSGGLDAKALFD